MKIFELMKVSTMDNIKKCVELLGIDNLTEEEQVLVLDEVSKYVFDINKRHSVEKKTFDLNLDYKYYVVDYLNVGKGINLNTDDISWWEFDAILEGIFLDEKSITNKMLNYRLYEKPPKNVKTQEEQEHRFRMKMKQKYALPEQINSDKGLEKLWNYVERKAGENNEC